MSNIYYYREIVDATPPPLFLLCVLCPPSCASPRTTTLVSHYFERVAAVTIRTGRLCCSRIMRACVNIALVRILRLSL